MAGAQSVDSDPEETTPVDDGQTGSSMSCDEMRLEGASTRSDEDAAFREDWRPALHRAAECLAAIEHDRACIEVQGQFDDRTFGGDMRRVVGGSEAAQIQRARGRSGAVVSELVDSLGVDYTRIRERPPGTEPTYRGVRLRVVDDCLPGPPPAAELPEWASSPEALEATMRQRGLVQDAPDPEPEPEPEEAGPTFGPFSIDTALTLGLIQVEPNDGYTVDLRLSAGWGEDFVYARAFVGLGTSDALEQRTAFEWGLAGGIRPLRWLRVGGRFTHRLGTLRPFETWLEQSWLIGIESEQRIVQTERVSIWIGEHLTPFGWRLQRASVDNGGVIDTPNRSDYAFVAGISFIVRGHLPQRREWPGAPPGANAGGD